MKKTKRSSYLTKRVFIMAAAIVIVGFVGLQVGRQIFRETAEAKQPAPVTQNSLPSIFKDPDTGLSLSIQLATGQTDTGVFDFFVPDTGFYHGVISLHKSGNNIVHPQGTTDAKFFPLNNGLPTTSQVKMEGEIDTNHATASVDLWIDNVHYHLLVKQADTSLSTSSARKAAASIVSADWPSLYSQLSSEVQNTTTESQFDEYMGSNSSQDIVNADLDGGGQANNISGNTYYTQPVVLTVQNPDGTTSVFHANMFFVWENNSWKLLSTDTPKQ